MPVRLMIVDDHADVGHLIRAVVDDAGIAACLSKARELADSWGGGSSGPPGMMTRIDRHRQGPSYMRSGEESTPVHRAEGAIGVEASGLSIDREELAELAIELGDLDSPPGLEAEAGEYVYRWMDKEGFEPRRLGLVPDRFNVLGRLAGAGDGYSLIFNSHLDTAVSSGDVWSLRDPAAKILHSAWREGDVLYGEGVVNDKGPMAAFLLAAKAVRDSGVELRGDLLLSAVPGEIGYEPVDEFVSPRYLSKELGTRYLIQHGGVADFAVVAEGTDFRVASIEAGKAFFKIVVEGDRQYYTPLAPAAQPGPEHPNAIVRAAALIPALQAWACEYEQRYIYESEAGTIVPKVTIGAIRGGNPYHVTRTTELCALYVDCRLTPEHDPLDLRRQLGELMAEHGIPGSVELFLYRRSYEPGDTGELMDAVSAAHRAMFGTDPGRAEPFLASMWRDVSIFNEMGIPSVTYGPPRRLFERSVELEQLHRCAQVYALIALAVCSKPKPRPATRGAPTVPS